jgi:gliding motility-associated-like protein
MQNPPAWINADFATVTDDSKISLSFTIDPASETDTFALERRTGFSGVFNEISRFTGTDIKSVTYTDEKVNPDEIYFYRLSAVICRTRAIFSNHASDIVPDALNRGSEIELKWNRYRAWNGTVSSYLLSVDRGSGFSELATTGPADTSYIVKIPDIMYSLTGGEVCFRIKASETGNPYGITGESTSGTVCLAIEENVTVPNIFSPDGDNLNDLFKPVLTFTPSEYHLVISDRKMKTVFETRSHTEAWDGSDDGKPLPEGVYVWFLKIRTPSGKMISRTGTVTTVKK